MSKKRDFLSLWDVSETEFAALIRRAEELRFLRQVGTPHATRPGRVLALIFEKASTRTRVSFEVAIWELGGHAVVMGRNDSQLGRGEPIKDTARVMSRYCHGIMVRTFGHERVTELAEFSSVPVINGLTDLLHPCQVLADLQTVYAHFADQETQRAAGAVPDVLQVLRSQRYAWVGDGNNMANTWIEAAGLLGLDLMLACPAGYQPNPQVL
ncbi:MAG TPA: ornithine carbamoyltransferase, partial [Polyangia bacterium]